MRTRYSRRKPVILSGCNFLMCFSPGRGSLLYRGDESLDPRSFLRHHWRGTVADDEMTWRAVRMTERRWQGGDKGKFGERLAVISSGLGRCICIQLSARAWGF